MKPCDACLKQYGKQLCGELRHCVFEDSGEWPTGAAEAPAPSAELSRPLTLQH